LYLQQGTISTQRKHKERSDDVRILEGEEKKKTNTGSKGGTDYAYKYRNGRMR